ncbi:hypothetical protein [Lacipirellula parvula]|uniref:Uncharacterized protein n=1 Tax=Lacipirellula parvula TaxID=2650471 RepID=A0A5K7XEG5_9BACT|nr:hypothetical protein [Lacipirellula parvula]BBO34775.1 hypothetical protein PLANPX_4387 [Lacipirellula parvula]
MTDQLRALKLAISLLALASVIRGTQPSNGATIDLSVTAALNLVSVVHPEVEMESPPHVLTSLEIPLPAVTLTGGDTLRVAVDFAGGQYFQRIAPPDGGFSVFYYGLSLQNDRPEGSVSIDVGNPGRRADWFDATGNLALQSQPSSFLYVNPSNNDLWRAELREEVASNFAEPTPQAGSKFVYEWTMPTQVPVHFIIPNPPAFGTRTFSNNSVKLLFRISSPFGTTPLPHAAVAVPEPAAWWLALAACGAWAAYCRGAVRRSALAPGSARG